MNFVVWHNISKNEKTKPFMPMPSHEIELVVVEKVEQIFIE